MPASYLIRPLLETVIIELTGVVSDADLIDGQTRLFREMAFRGDYARLIDCTGVARISATEQTIRMVAQASLRKGLTRVAVVVTSFPVPVAGVVNIYQSYVQDGRAHCVSFGVKYEALRWLATAAKGNGARHVDI